MVLRKNFGLGLKLPFGLLDGRVVEPCDVPNGLACNCQCPGCAQALIAYNEGRIRVPYFGHAPGNDCRASALESALHLAAKQVLREAVPGEIRLPIAAVNAEGLSRPYWREGRWTDHESHSTTHVLNVSRTAEILSVDEELEVRLAWSPAPTTSEEATRAGQGGLFDEPVLVDAASSKGVGLTRVLRPDVIAHGVDAPLWIEILVTHAVARDKQAVLQSQGWRALEIDISPWLRRPVTFATLRNAVLDELEGKRWLSYPGAVEAASQIRASEADQRAQAREAAAFSASGEGLSPPAIPDSSDATALPMRPGSGRVSLDHFNEARLRQHKRGSQHLTQLTYGQWRQAALEARIDVRARHIGVVTVFPEFRELPDRESYECAVSAGSEAVALLSQATATPLRWIGAGRIGATPEETIRGRWIDDKWWPKLVGSVKQIAWAEAIRRKHLFANPSDVDSVYRTEASWWIQNQNRLGKV